MTASASALPDLPGSSGEAGSGPVVPELTEALLDDAGTLTDFRRHRSDWYRDEVGALVVDAAAMESFIAGLEAPDHALPILLRATRRQDLRGARDLVAEDDRVELVGVRLPLVPADGGAVRSPGIIGSGSSSRSAAEQLLAALDFSVPAWIELAPVAGWPEAVAVLAEDGAENVTALLDGADAEDAARLLRALLDHDLSFRLARTDPDAELPLVTVAGTTPNPPVYGALNVLCAVRAGLNGAGAAALAPMLTETDPAPLTSALRRMSEADAALARAFLVSVTVRDAGAAVAGLVELGLLTAG